MSINLVEIVVQSAPLVDGQTSGQTWTWRCWTDAIRRRPHESIHLGPFARQLLVSHCHIVLDLIVPNLHFNFPRVLNEEMSIIIKYPLSSSEWNDFVLKCYAKLGRKFK